MDPSYSTPNYYSQQNAQTQLSSHLAFNPSQNSYFQLNLENNSLENLNKGWFKCYQIALSLEIIRRTWNMLSLSYRIFYYNDLHLDTTTSVISWAFYFTFMTGILIQFVAIKDRDLTKAKVALICHAGFLFISIVYQVASSYAFFGYLRLPLGLKWTVFSAVIVIPGSFKVLRFLKANKIQSEADHYQSSYQA